MGQYKKILVADLINDDRYQRPLDEKRVAKIAAGFDPKLVGVLEVSVRNGKCAVMDGQHRVNAMNLLGWEKVPCIVHSGLSPQEEAEMFVAFQDKRKSITQVDRFRALVFAEDETAVAINTIVEDNGFVINDAGTTGSIRAIVAVRNIYKRGGAKLLDDTLKLVAQVWPGDPKATDGYFLEGASELLRGYCDRIDEAVAAKLAEVAPLTILRHAMGQMAGGGSNARRGVIAAELRRAGGLRGRPASKLYALDAEVAA